MNRMQISKIENSDYKKMSLYAIHFEYMDQCVCVPVADAENSSSELREMHDFYSTSELRRCAIGIKSDEIGKYPPPPIWDTMGRDQSRHLFYPDG